MSHVERTTRIHAPLPEVYALAHDPSHWSEWYVGVSDEEDLEPDAGPGPHRHLMVGTPFPLTQRVLEDSIGPRKARWRVTVEGLTESVRISRFCKLLMLTVDHDWLWEAKGDETEVTVNVDYNVPAELLEEPADSSVVERMEAVCIERSLAKLRELCEAES